MRFVSFSMTVILSMIEVMSFFTWIHYDYHNIFFHVSDSIFSHGYFEPHHF